jgi:phosphohistidine phosphatase SixA
MNDLLNIVKEIPDSNQQVLLVGHNPTLLEFINFLSAGKKQSMSTCELTQLSSSTNWHHTIEGSFQFISGHRSANQ